MKKRRISVNTTSNYAEIQLCYEVSGPDGILHYFARCSITSHRTLSSLPLYCAKSTLFKRYPALTSWESPHLLMLGSKGNSYFPRSSKQTRIGTTKPHQLFRVFYFILSHLYTLFWISPSLFKLSKASASPSWSSWALQKPDEYWNSFQLVLIL